MSDDRTQPIRPPFLHTDLPYAQQKQVELAVDLIRNAITLSKDAGVSPPLMLNALLSQAALVAACAPSAAARGLIVDTVEENFGALVAAHLASQRSRADG